MIAILLIYVFNMTIGDIFFCGFARPKLRRKVKQKSYLIKQRNRFAYQQYMECSGYSSAFLLRHFGMEAEGVTIYEQMPYKMKNGYVFPRSIPKVLHRYGIQAQYQIGNIATLKNEIAKGSPVITLIRYQVGKNWLHYLPIVGYDEEYIYAVDSLKDQVNCETSEYYNRRIPVKEFKKLWNTSMFIMPLYRNTYYAVRQTN